MALPQSFHQSGLEEGKNFVDWREREGRKPFPPIPASFSSYFPPIASPSPPSSSLFFLFLSPTLTSNSLPRRTGMVASIVAAKEATCKQRISRLILSAGRKCKILFLEIEKKYSTMSHHHLVLQVAIIVKQVGQVEEVHWGGSHIYCSSWAKNFVANATAKQQVYTWSNKRELTPAVRVGFPCFSPLPPCTSQCAALHLQV